MDYYEWVYGASDVEMEKTDWLDMARIQYCNDYNEFDLISGKMLQDNPVEYGMYSDPGVLLDCIKVSGALWLKVISSRMKNYLEAQAAGELQYFPVKIVNGDSSGEVSGYSIVNVLEPVDCIDVVNMKIRKLGKYYWPFEIDMVDSAHYKYLIDPEKIPRDRKIFRCMKRPDILIVRDDIMKGIIDNGFSGVRFEKIRTK